MHLDGVCHMRTRLLACPAACRCTHEISRMYTIARMRLHTRVAGLYHVWVPAGKLKLQVKHPQVRTKK